jgi:hypothetical protein
MTAIFSIIITELVVGMTPEEPMVRLLTMPLPTLLAFLGLEMSIMELMYVFRLRAPIRVSSVAKGQLSRPPVYPFIEDVIAVDGNGGTTYRMRLHQRYEASPYFRQMLHKLSFFWTLSALLVSGGTTYMVYSINRDDAYVVSWSFHLSPCPPQCLVCSFCALLFDWGRALESRFGVRLTDHTCLARVGCSVLMVRHIGNHYDKMGSA